MEKPENTFYDDDIDVVAIDLWSTAMIMMMMTMM